MKKLSVCVLALAVGVFPASSAIADEGGLTGTIGLKAWANTWNTWNNYHATDSATDFAPVVQSLESSGTTALIPSVSVRYRDFLLATSYFAKKSYTFTPSFDFETKRDEYDVTAGYYVLPSLAVTVGYKHVKQQFGPSDYTYSGPIVGFTGSAPLTGGFSLYGTAAVGASFKGKANVAGFASYNVDYRLGEVGLAYAFATGGMTLKSVVASFGYRNQSIVSKLPGAWSGQSGRDVTDGLTLGIGAAF